MRGGRNPYGEPMYRLVWAPGRICLCGGEWLEWDPNLSANDRNPLHNTPIRSVVETRPLRMYKDRPQHWVLERWRPADAWGTPERWYMLESAGGTMKVKQGKLIAGLGDYPYRGDYVATSFYFKNYQLTEAVVLNLVGLIEKGFEAMPKDPARRMALAARMAEEEERAASERRIEEDRETLRSLHNPLKSWSLGGQAAACRDLERMGITSHPF